MTPPDLKTILDKHAAWLRGEFANGEWQEEK